MAAPQRIQLSRAKGWRMPENTVRVARPGIWGNPFVHDNVTEAVDAYRRLLSGGTQRFDMGPGKLQFAKGAHEASLHWDFATWVKDHIGALRAKNLACWCKPGAPSHADVLLELANR